MVTIVVTTYNPVPEAPRFDYLQKSLQSLIDHFIWADEPVRYLIADDGSPLTPQVQVPSAIEVKVVTGPHGGIGASLNRAMRHVLDRDELWMYTTDDWVLHPPCDGNGIVDLDLATWLLRTQGYDYVRLGPIHPNLKCLTQFTAGHGWWLDLDFTYGGYVFATRPFIATRRFYDKIGPFLEGVDAYVCERDYADRCTDYARFHQLHAAALTLVGPWHHIGEFEVGDLPVI